MRETRKRLNETSLGFDSIDKRMFRAPNDLNNRKIRDWYFHKHINWFFINYTNTDVQKFIRNFLKKYNRKLTDTELHDMKLTAKKYNCNAFGGM